LIVFVVLSFQYTEAQSHTQRAAITHARMTQQMNHNFHMMHLNMANNSAKSVKKNVKYINKRLKHNYKTVTKYNKKLLKLEQKLQATEVNDTKKQQRLKKWIGIYKNAIEAINTENTELKTLQQKQKKLLAKKEAEK